MSKNGSKKGSMELSVNSIVILVVAITMLGLILGFVTSKMKETTNAVTVNEADAPTASASNPITMSRTQIAASSGDQLGLKYQVYNTNAASAAFAPTIGCVPNTAIVTVTVSAPKTIATGDVETYESITKITGPKGKYICTLNAMKCSGAALSTCTTAASPTIDKEFTLTIN